MEGLRIGWSFVIHTRCQLHNRMQFTTTTDNTHTHTDTDTHRVVVVVLIDSKRMESTRRKEEEMKIY